MFKPKVQWYDVDIILDREDGFVRYVVKVRNRYYAILLRKDGSYVLDTTFRNDKETEIHRRMLLVVMRNLKYFLALFDLRNMDKKVQTLKVILRGAI